MYCCTVEVKTNLVTIYCPIALYNYHVGSHGMRVRIIIFFTSINNDESSITHNGFDQKKHFRRHRSC